MISGSAELLVRFRPKMFDLILLPGMDGTGLLFAGFVQALGDRHSTDVIEYPNDMSLDYAQLADLVFRRLPSNRPFVLLAESFSGPIALSIAQCNPPHLKAVILVASFAQNPRPIVRSFAWLLRMLDITRKPKWLLRLLLLNRATPSALVDRVSFAIDQVDSKVLRHRLAELLRLKPPQHVGAMQLPVLYLQASRDRLVPASAVDTIRYLCRDMICRTLPGPHLLLQANPAGSAQAVSEFLDTIHASA